MVAVVAATAALLGAFFLTYWLALGEIGFIVWFILPIAAGIWAFIFAFRKVSSYISN